MRRFFTITLTAATLVVVVLWVVSYWWMIDVRLPVLTSDCEVNASVVVGRVWINITPSDPSPSDRGPRVRALSVEQFRQHVRRAHARFMGARMPEGYPLFEWHGPGSPANMWYGQDEVSVRFPTWLLVLLLGPWPAYQLFLWFRRRTQPGLCGACGYDLRGTPSGMCPECGVSSKPSQPAGDAE